MKRDIERENRHGTYDLEEQEQLAELKAWWKQYGNLIVAAFVAAALVFVAWRGWHWYQGSQSAQASATYSELQKAVAAKDTKKVRDLAGAADREPIREPCMRRLARSSRRKRTSPPAI